MFFRTFSAGCPFLSYMARRKNGSMRMTMTRTAVLTPNGDLSKKKTGTPTSAPLPKQMSCRFVRLKRTLVFTLDKSFGTGT